MTIDYKQLGNEAFASKKYGEALDYFTKGIEQDPSNHILYSNRSAVYISLEKYQEALNDAEKCVELNKNWSKGYSRKGCAEFKLKKYSNAVESYRKALELDPNNSTIKENFEQSQEACKPQLQMQNLINELISNTLSKPKFKEYAEQDSTYEQRLRETLQSLYQDPKNLNLAMGYSLDAKVQEGLKDILHIPMSDPDSGFQTSEPVKKPEKKQEEPKKTEKTVSPEQLEADEWKNKGNEFYKKREFQKALECYDKAISIYPNSILYNTNKAAVYMEMGDNEACLNECQKAIDRRYDIQAPFEHVAKAYVRMASCYRKMEDYASAIEMYQKALTEDNNRHTRAALNETKSLKEKQDREKYIDPELAAKHRLKGNEYFKEGLYPEAKKEYDEAIRRNPNDAKCFANRSAVLMKLLELPMALSDAEKSLELDPTVTKVWARKGTIHMMMKEYNKALSAFMKGLEIDKESPECCRGFEEVSMKIQDSSTSDQIDEEQIKRAMADPEIQAIISDPQISLVLKGISEDPRKLQSALKDPRIAISIQKLMAAGILKLK